MLMASRQRKTEIPCQTGHRAVRALHSAIMWGGLLTASAVGAQPLMAASPPLQTLAASVALTLQHNKTIQAAYLDRIAQRFDLRVAESKFNARFGLAPGLSRGQATVSDNPALTANTASLQLTAEQDLPTGARISLNAGETNSQSPGANTQRNQNWAVALTQPLLKGAGTDAATASVRLAQLTEQTHLLSLKSVISNTLTDVIRSYRQYVRTLRALDISRQSVARARDLLAINRTLIQSGRMAEIDLVQSESDLANQEFGLVAAENDADTARLTLLKVLGLDPDTPFQPDLELSVEPVTYELAHALQTARANRPDVLAAELAVTLAETRLLTARNQQLPDLSLVASYGRNRVAFDNASSLPTPSQWSLGLRLNVPFNDLRIEQAVVAAQVEKDKAVLRLAQEQDNLTLEVRNALRQVDLSWRQVNLSQRALNLADRKFEVETEKFKVGRSSNFQLVSFKNDLVTAQNNALNASIAYLDAVASLDATLGTVLDTWQVTLTPR
jgi:outer membrane protein TolC